VGEVAINGEGKWVEGVMGKIRCEFVRRLRCKAVFRPEDKWVGEAGMDREEKGEKSVEGVMGEISCEFERVGHFERDSAAMIS